MSIPKRKVSQRTAVQEALMAMRRRLNLSRPQLAQAMKVTPVTVGRWESTRSPTGSSLSQLAAFAQQAGDAEGAKIFHEATLPGNLGVDEWEALQASEAPMKALKQIQSAARYDESLRKEYYQLLNALTDTHTGLIASTVERMIDSPSTQEDLTELAAVQKYLRKERDEQKPKSPF